MHDSLSSYRCVFLENLGFKSEMSLLPIATNPAIVNIYLHAIHIMVDPLKLWRPKVIFRGILQLTLVNSEKSIGVNLSLSSDALEVTLLNMESQDCMVPQKRVLKP